MTEAPIYDRVTFAPGKLLIRPGDRAHCAYLIQSGNARVFRDEDGHHKELAIIGPGEIVGDMALIRKTPHRSGVEAVTPVVAITISLQHIEKKIHDADPLIKSILQGMLKRIDRMNKEK